MQCASLNHLFASLCRSYPAWISSSPCTCCCGCLSLEWNRSSQTLRRQLSCKHTPSLLCYRLLFRVASLSLPWAPRNCLASLTLMTCMTGRQSLFSLASSWCWIFCWSRCCLFSLNCFFLDNGFVVDPFLAANTSSSFCGKCVLFFPMGSILICVVICYNCGSQTHSKHLKVP